MKIEQKMDSMGFREQLAGTAMLRSGIALYERNSWLTKEIYPAIAKAAGTSAARVERNMRYAIQAAWDNLAGADGRLRYYGPTVQPPTVGEFIARMARDKGEE